MLGEDGRSPGEDWLRQIISNPHRVYCAFALQTILSQRWERESIRCAYHTHCLTLAQFLLNCIQT